MVNSGELCTLDGRHLAGCLALSQSARWNQNAADWRLMLKIGRGWGVVRADGTLAASTLVLPYGNFAWVSMVLVLPGERRKGHATRLLRTALDDLKRARLTPILDATPAGRTVYVQEGFHDTWGFRRFALRSAASAVHKPAGVRPLRAQARGTPGRRHPTCRGTGARASRRSDRRAAPRPGGSVDPRSRRGSPGGGPGRAHRRRS